MADDITNDSDESSETAQETGKGLRAQLEQTIAREKKYKTQLLDQAYHSLNLDPTIGLGKAVAKEYDGEPTAEALAEYVKTEYSYTYTPTPVPNPLAGQIVGEQAKLDAAASGSGSVPIAPTEVEALAAAEAAGDYATTMAIKSQQIANNLFRPGR